MNITAKMGILEITRKSIEKALDEGSEINEVERKISFSKIKVNEIQELKLKIQEEKLLEGEELNTVETWGKQLNEKLEIYEKNHTKTSSWLDYEHQKEREEISSLEQEKSDLEFSRAIEKEKRLLEAKLKIREEYENKVSIIPEKQQNTSNFSFLRMKLPELKMAKFNGEHTDFVRFWSTFIEGQRS